MNDIERALTFLQGIPGQDAALATRHVDPRRYVKHDPRIGDGIEGVRRYVDAIASDGPRLDVVRAYQDGSCVFTQADGHLRGDGRFFDVFRFEDGLIVEHWGFSAKAGPPEHGEDARASEALVREYYETVHIGGRHDLIARYISEPCIRHEPGVADGVEAFMRDLRVLTRDRTIDEVELLLGQGDFVYLAASGTHRGEPCAYIDLYRVEGRVEHRGFPQPAAPPARRMNDDGKLRSAVHAHPGLI